MYDKLSDMGYTHEKVNHSVEFVNADGSKTNKTEGHWRQMKSSLPTHGRRKYHYASYLAEFMYRYKYAGQNLFMVFIKHVSRAYNPMS